jgi:ATP-dependent RNA helicase DeaD
MSQDERDRVMKKLRANAVDLLVATDVAARGLDISHLTHVINYEVPSAPTAYVHRIGRVGRAGREGVAITLAEPREHGLLRNIERLTKQKISVESLPTVADLRARRLEITRASIREALIEGELDRFRAVVETLSDEFDLFDVALGAVTIAHEATASGADEDEEEIPTAHPVPEKGKGKGKGKGGGEAGAGSAGAKGGGRRNLVGTRLFIGAGRIAGIRPKDLVGAITGEAGVSGDEIGSIQISDKFSLVEVADHVADEVLHALRGTKIKGKKVTVRPDKGR